MDGPDVLLLVGKAAPVPAQRVDGAARVIAMRDRDGRSRIMDIYQRAPARLLFPQGPPGEPPLAVLVTTSGGLTGGDRIAIDVEAGPGAAITVTTQAAEKIYRCDEADCTVRVRLDAAAGASIEWLAQETILFDGAQLDRAVEVDLAPDSRLLAIESVVLGRGAMGERYSRGRLRDAWRVRRGGRPLWIDAFALDDVEMERSAPFGLGDAQAYATILLVALDADRQRDAARGLIADSNVKGGASVFDGMLIIRLFAADAMRLRAIVMAIGSLLRGAAMPRVWSC
jgi:urease accessory protein